MDIAKLLKKRVIRNNGLYRLFQKETKSGPLDGGCVAFAMALKEVVGSDYSANKPSGTGGVYVLESANETSDLVQAQHAVLKLGDKVYADADGIHIEDKLIKFWVDIEGLVEPVHIRPIESGDLPDSPRSKELVSKVVAYLNKEFKEGTTMSKAKQFLSIAEELTDQERKEKINSMIDEFSKDPEIVDFVKKTEKSLATTQNHYGKYMSFLTPFSSKPVTLYIMSKALIAAGANARGVGSALQVLKGD